MKRFVIPLAVFTILLTADGLFGGAGKDALTQLIDRVQARRGFSRRSAVIIPLVLRETVDEAEGLPDQGQDLTFLPVKDDLVSLVFSGKKTSLLPGGTLLFGFGRERVLSRSVFLVPGEELIVRSPFCDSRDEDAPEQTEGSAKFGPITPHAQRKAELLLRDRASLADIQRIQAALAGLGSETRTVREMMSAPNLRANVNSALSKFSGVPNAYGQAVAGHVLFVGLRPVEVVLFRNPADYRLHAPLYLKAAAVSLTLWEEYYNVDPLLAEEVDDRLLIPVAEKILATLRSGRPTRIRPAGKEKGGGDAYRIKTSSEDPVMKFDGRLLVDAEGGPFQLEAYQDGKRLVLPSPLTKPGGRPTDAKPDVSHGAMTQEFLERLMKRIRERRAGRR